MAGLVAEPRSGNSSTHRGDQKCMAALTPETIATLCRRIDAISSEARPQWGKMSAAQMLAHVRLAMEQTLQPTQQAGQSTWFRRNVVKYLALYVLPIPRNITGMPSELFASTPEELERERTACKAMVQRLAEHCHTGGALTAVHPLFGPLTTGQWQAMHVKHMDHHLRQFGV